MSSPRSSRVRGSTRHHREQDRSFRRNGASTVAQSKPDGYTILFAIASTIQAVGLQKNPPFKLSELAPIAQLAELPTGFAVRADLQAGTLADFVKFAKEKPGDLSFGSVGSGSTGHIIGEGLAAAAGMKMLHVPYKGEAPAITDLLGGHISSAFASVGGLGQYPDKVKLLAITGPHRLKSFPDVPTFQQLGYPLHGLTGWAGVFAPAATPTAVIDKLATEIGRIVRLPDVQAKILDFGFEPLGDTTEPFAAFVNAQAERWAAAAKEAGIEPQKQPVRLCRSSGPDARAFDHPSKGSTDCTTRGFFLTGNSGGSVTLARVEITATPRTLPNRNAAMTDLVSLKGRTISPLTLADI